MGVELFNNIKEKHDNIHNWGRGVSTRNISSEDGTALFIDSDIGSVGIPSSVEGRKKSKKQWGRRKLILLIKKPIEYPLTTAYVFITLCIGAAFQGWLS